MFYPRLSGDRYINPFTGFGFNRLFGTEANKKLLIDFLNVILPSQHQVKDMGRMLWIHLLLMARESCQT